MKVHGELMEHGWVFTIRRWWTKEPSREDVSSFARQRERPWKNMLLPKQSEEQLPHVPGWWEHSSPVPSDSFIDTNLSNEWKRYLGPAALVGPIGRSSLWVRFGGRACLCTAEHLRGVTPDEADCLGLDERTQLHELRRTAQELPENYEDLTSQPGPPPPVEGPTKPPGEPEEPSRDDLDIGMDAVEPMALVEGAGETTSSTEVGEQSISRTGRGASIGQQALAEIPYGKTAESHQFTRARLENPLDRNRGKLGRTKQNW